VLADDVPKSRPSTEQTENMKPKTIISGLLGIGLGAIKVCIL
jgi:hypothetical protein